MALLTAHLLETGDHGRLGFHPSCPICREQRLFGALPSEPVIPRRVQAALATGVFAFSSAAPAAVAQERDTQQEGVTAPDQPAGENADAPDFDPGGETGLPFEVAPEPTQQAEGDGDSDDGAPLEREPTADLDPGGAPPTGLDAPLAGSDEPVPRVETPEADESPARPDAAPPAPHLQSQVEEREPAANRSRPAPSPRPAPRPAGDPPIQSRSTPGPQVVPSLPAPAQEVALEENVQVLAQAGDLPQTQGPATGAGESPAGKPRVHLVQPGDSLWSIAKRLLGPDASPASVAREVARLWKLNSDRIGTGDPDLLMVGTRLRLR